ncbi:MAG TPA: hypothetical protein VF658_11870 [Pyrinomonadaceae bacterium]|jgi:hypothetical protein
MMKNFIESLIAVLIFGVLIGYPSAAQAQAKGKRATQSLISKARVDRSDVEFQGPLYVTINDKESKIADVAIDAWVINGGHQVVYSGRDGAGGFEDEGQSLRVYDARSGKIRKVMSEYVAVDEVTEVKTAGGKIALLVKMSDGGLGANYLAIVDPARGEVFFRRWVRLLSRKGDILTLGHYREDDWDKFLENKNAKVRPYRTEKVNLSAALKRRVIVNKRDRDF